MEEAAVLKPRIMGPAQEAMEPMEPTMVLLRRAGVAEVAVETSVVAKATVPMVRAAEGAEPAEFR